MKQFFISQRQRVLSIYRLYGIGGFLRFVIYETRYCLRAMLLKSYSQHSEDLLISSLLQNTESRYFLDVGAHHPTRFNNTKRLYDRGWCGINVEPDDLLISSFHTKRPRDINLGCVVGATGTSSFFIFHTPTLNTSDSSVAEYYTSIGFPVAKVVSADSLPAHIIWSRYMEGKLCSFMNIDVEGGELMVLTTNDWDILAPKLVCIETMSLTRDIKNPLIHNREIIKFMEQKGYKIYYQNTINTIFIRDL